MAVQGQKRVAKKQMASQKRKKVVQVGTATKTTSALLHSAAAEKEESDVDDPLEDDDYTIFEHYGKAAEFLGSLDTDRLHPSKAEPTALHSKTNKKGSKAVEAAPAVGEDHIGGEEADAEDYERNARSVRANDGEVTTGPLLPFKAPDGSLIFPAKWQPLLHGLSVVQPVAGITILDDALDAAVESNKAVDMGTAAATNRPTPTLVQVDHRGRQLQTTPINQHLESVSLRPEEARRRIAGASSKLLEAPEESAPCLRVLLESARSMDTQVSKLALVSLLNVFKNIIPGYKIRELTGKELEVKVSRAVQRMRDFEFTLLKAFRAYIKLLRNIVGPAEVGISHRRIAVKCLCGLLDAVPHFNHMSEVLQAIVPRVGGSDLRMRTESCTSLSRLLGRRQQEEIMVEAVQLVADMVRQQKCVCHPDALRSLFTLQFADLTRSDVEKGAAHLRKKVKMKTRKQREDAIVTAMQEAEARRDVEQARVHQSQMLEALFELLFRVLKQCTASGALRGNEGAGTAVFGACMGPRQMMKKFPLLLPALEGLGKYTHLISVEYSAALLKVLEDLLDCRGLPQIERFQCLLTAMEILKAQGDALLVDRQGLYRRLYSALALSPLRSLDCTLEGGSAELSESQTEAFSQLPSLTAKTASLMLTELKIGDFARLGAFAKRLCTSAAHSEPGRAMAFLLVASRLLLRHTKLKGLLESECVGTFGQGGYNPFSADPGDACALQSTLWELNVLQAHYNPDIARMASAMARIPVDGSAAGWSGPVAAGQDAVPVAEGYAFEASGLFRPALKPASRARTSSLRRSCKLHFTSSLFQCAEAQYTSPAGGGMHTEPTSQDETGTADELVSIYSSLQSDDRRWRRDLYACRHMRL